MGITRVLTRLASALLAFACTAAPCISDAAYPERPITLVVPFSSGGTVDAVARLVAAKLGDQLKTKIIVENVTGAGGTIATERVARARPDGLTLLFTTPNHTINPSLMHHLPFDTEHDFAPISMVAQIPELLVANSKEPFADFRGFVAYAQAHPGQLNYGSAGIGTLPHVTMELLLQKLGLRVAHIPYKGAAPAMNDLLGGQVALKMDTVVTALPQIKAGRLRPLAFAGAKRAAQLPDVPTLGELGISGYDGMLWMAILAPRGTPQPVIDAVNQAIVRAVHDPDLLRSFAIYGVEPVGSAPAELQARIAAELKQWSRVVTRAGIAATD